MSEQGFNIDIAIPLNPTPKPKTELGVGHVLRDRYQIEGRLGAGSIGVVYKALDRVRSEHAEFGGHVAIKVLVAEPGERVAKLAQLRHEFYCTQSLSHPSIVKVFEFENDQDVSFFSMELLEGELLSTVIGSSPKGVARPRAWTMIRELGAALDHAHSRNVVHGDLQPHNIMVLKVGGLRILNFGAHSGEGGAPALALAYRSCELLEGQEAEVGDDVFALACVAYELLTGVHPFQQRRATEARDAKISAREPKGVTARQWQALQRGLAWEREDRPDSMHAWLSELIVGSGAPQLAARERELAEASSGKSGWSAKRWVAVLAAPVMLVMAWAMVHALSQPKPSVDVPVVALVEAPPVVAIPTELDLKEKEASFPDIDDTQPAAAAAAPAPVRVRRVASLSKTLSVERIAFATASYDFDHGTKFAEIHVRRSAAQVDKTNFVWWTESGSAVEGNDFVAQGRSTAYFSPGDHLATLFVKLVPTAKRKKPQVFYVVISDPSAGAEISGVPRAAIKLLPP
jgi:serine/threonine protein kinase